MFKHLLSLLLLFGIFDLGAQSNLVKFGPSSSGKYNIEENALSGRSSSKIYWTVSGADYNADDLVITFSGDVIGLVITGIGQMSGDGSSFEPIGFSVSGKSESGASVEALMAAESAEDALSWDAPESVLHIERSISSPVHLLFRSGVREIQLGNATGNANIQFIHIEGFYEGATLYSPAPEDPVSLDCDSLHTAFIVDVSNSIDANDLTYISNRINEWVEQRRLSHPEDSAHRVSVVAFAGESKTVLSKVAIGSITFSTIYNGLESVQPALLPHTNWISALERALATGAGRNVFIADGWHNGRAHLHDSLSNDLDTLQGLAAQLRSQGLVYAVAIDGLAQGSNSDVLRLVCGAAEQGQGFLTDSAGGSWWISIEEAFDRCTSYDFNLTVDKSGSDALELEWKGLEGVEEYDIYRKEAGGSWERREGLMYSRSTGGYRATDRGLNPGLYSYQVRAKKDRNELQTNEGKGEIAGLLSCYPNPADNFVVLDLRIKNPNARHITITDMLGREYGADIDSGDSRRWRIDTRHLVPGGYIITYHDRQAQIISKVRFVIL